MNENKRYMLLQGCFWMLFCTGTCYVSLYLQHCGLSNGDIGMVTAIFGTLAAVAQPVLGRLCDGAAFLTWKRMLLLLCVPFPVVCGLMLLGRSAWLGSLSMGLLLFLANAMMPFVNSASVFYRAQGCPINFGVARGIGSGMYALLALLMGQMAAQFGIAVIPVSGIVVSALMLLSVSRMPCRQPAMAQTAQTAARGSMLDFVRRYPAFALMLVACLFSLTSHNITGTYLLQIIQSLGGDSGDLGITMAIQALVEVPVLFGFSLLLKRFRPGTLVMIATGGYALKALLYALAHTIPTIWLLQVTQMLSFAIYASASVYYAAECIRAEDQVTGQALMTSTIAIGTVAGSLLGGVLLEYTSIGVMLWVNVLLAVMGLIIAIPAWRMYTGHADSREQIPAETTR